MSRIPAIDPTRAEGKAKTLLDAVKAKLGITPNLTKVMANAPAVLEGYLGLSGALAGGTLPTQLRELLAVNVGEANGCDYCVSAHTAIGKRVGLSGEQLVSGRKGTADDPKTATALRFARQVLEARGQVSDADLEAVRAAGFGDAEVTEIVAHVALNVLTNYLNNVARTEIDFPKAEPLAGHEARAKTPGCAVTR